jgi:hypothetical protein
MRKTATALVVAALLVTGACGGDDDDDSSSGGNDGGSGSKSEFCVGLKNVYEDLGGGADVDPSDDQGKAAFAALKDLDPPDEIADDWGKFVDYLDTVAAGKTPSEDEASEWLDATLRLNTYAEDKCGIKAPGSE